MDKYRLPQPQHEPTLLYTEGIDFFRVPGDASIMGEKRRGIVGLFERTSLSGTWLDLGAGDGRYTDMLIDGCDRVVALDADKSALSKLWHRTSPKDRGKLELVVHNIKDPLPFASEAMDGVLCVGLLHYFPPSVLRRVTMEIRRIIRDEGIVLLELSTEIQRLPMDGVGSAVERGMNHRFADGCALLRGAFRHGFDYELGEEGIEREPMILFGRRFTWSSRDIHVRAQKRRAHTEEQI